MSQWKWCVTDDSGKVIKGWYKDNDKWYHLDETTGVMNTGWFQDKDGRWYYLDEKNGDMKTGWIQLKGIWYYLEPSSNGYQGSCYVNCTSTIDGKEYTFDANGHMLEESLVSDALIDFIKSWEGFSATPYFDMVGVKTLGYGMTGDEIEGLDSITEAEATTMLKVWINKKYAPIIKADLDNEGVSLTQNEFDALVSFAYNCGTAGLLGSTLYKNVVAGVRDSTTITANFQAWSNGGGTRIEGLYRRRTKEASMFLNADYTGNV
ncbi:glycoside hydrolase family protein [Clostridium sp.]|uniref:lysozyme n=1 Tax=Clostridium sp. TaxID=1506 RepID=UPI0028425A7B|nr:glycoside hydrolase family protein [Clostridium sp.]MDR3598112.1 glycoside hydrolase family protein [Clostridium sp.]